MTDAELQYNFNVIRSLLISQGLSETTATFAAAQVMHETNGLQSRVVKENNNLSGIIWLNRSHQKNATRGTARPKSEGGYYAKFASVRDWAKDFIRILSYGERPILAKTLPDYVERLRANGYFTDSKENYYNGVLRWLNRVGKSIPVNAPVRVDNGVVTQQQSYNIDNPNDKSDNILNRLFDDRFDGKNEKLILFGTVGLLGLILLLRR